MEQEQNLEALPSVLCCCCCCCWVASVMSNSVRPHRGQPTKLSRPWDSPGENIGVDCHFLLQCRKVKMKVKSPSCVQLLATPWTAAYQAPPSMGFSRQEHWSGLPFSSPMHACMLNRFSHVQPLVTPWTIDCTRLLCPWDFPGKSTGVGWQSSFSVSSLLSLYKSSSREKSWWSSL